MTKWFYFSLILCTCLCLSPLAATEVPAQFKGYIEINRILKERIIRPSGFQLGKYLGEGFDVPRPNSLVELLGTFVGSGTDSKFRNGSPNSVNMLLWYLAF